MTKQELIKKAWGKHWDRVKDFVNNEGYVHFGTGSLLDRNENIFWNNGDFDCFDTIDDIGFNGESIGASQFRPNSLIGIENNNGWIKIESEADLPNIDGTYFVRYSNGSLSEENFSTLVSDWIGESRVTHYQTIVKPKPPIY